MENEPFYKVSDTNDGVVGACSLLTANASAVPAHGFKDNLHRPFVNKRGSVDPTLTERVD